jgi:hypothetical protein
MGVLRIIICLGICFQGDLIAKNWQVGECVFVVRPQAKRLAVAEVKEPSRENLREIILSQVGVTELTGKNDGVQVEAYLKSSGLKKGHPWCAAFIFWCYKKAGYIVKINNPAYSPNWFPKDRLIYSKNIRQSLDVANKPVEWGDVVGFYFPELKRIAHIEFVDEWGEKYVVCVGGNTTNALNREGNGVFRNKRTKRSIMYAAKWID